MKALEKFNWSEYEEDIYFETYGMLLIWFVW